MNMKENKGGFINGQGHVKKMGESKKVTDKNGDDDGEGQSWESMEIVQKRLTAYGLACII